MRLARSVTQAIPWVPTAAWLPSNVYFSEPQTTPWDLNFSLFGIPVRVSPWFWLGSAIFGFGMASHDIKLLFIWEVAVLISILLHEMGHAFMMRRFGEDPRVVLTFMGGLAIGGGGRSTSEQVMVSAAGPAAQLFLAAFCVAAVRASGYDYPAQVPFWNNAWFNLTGNDVNFLPYQNLNFFLAVMLLINVFWALVNLVPVWPLDGGQIVRAVMAAWNRDGARKSLVVSAIAGAAVAIYGFKEEQPFMGMMFAALAFDSFQTYQGARGRW